MAEVKAQKGKVPLRIFSHNGTKFERTDYVDGEIFGDLAIYDAESGCEGQMDVGHIPSGYKVAADLKPSDANAMVRELLALNLPLFVSLAQWISDDMRPTRTAMKEIVKRYTRNFQSGIEESHRELASKGF